jgi:ribosome-binding factor A
MKHKRCDKVAETIHETISAILSKGLNDPRIGFVTIIAVDVTVDLRLAKVFFTVIGDDLAKKNSEAGLNSAKSYIRRELGKVLSLRFLPDIVFAYDHSQEYGNHIDTILREIDKEHDGNNSEDR